MTVQSSEKRRRDSCDEVLGSKCCKTNSTDSKEVSDVGVFRLYHAFLGFGRDLNAVEDSEDTASADCEPADSASLTTEATAQSESESVGEADADTFHSCSSSEADSGSDDESDEVLSLCEWVPEAEDVCSFDDVEFSFWAGSSCPTNEDSYPGFEVEPEVCEAAFTFPRDLDLL